MGKGWKAKDEAQRVNLAIRWRRDSQLLTNRLGSTEWNVTMSSDGGFRPHCWIDPDVVVSAMMMEVASVFAKMSFEVSFLHLLLHNNQGRRVTFGSNAIECVGER